MSQRMVALLLFLLPQCFKSMVAVVYGETITHQTNELQHKQDHALRGGVWDVTIVNDRVLREDKKKSKKNKMKKMLKSRPHSMKSSASVKPCSRSNVDTVEAHGPALATGKEKPSQAYPSTSPKLQWQFHPIPNKTKKGYARLPYPSVPIVSPDEYIDRHDEAKYANKAKGAALAPWFQCSDDPCIFGVKAVEVARHSCAEKTAGICRNGASCNRLCKTKMPPTYNQPPIPQVKNRCTTTILPRLTECVGTCRKDESCKSQYGQESRCVHPCSKDGISAGCHCMV